MKRIGFIVNTSVAIQRSTKIEYRTKIAYNTISLAFSP